MTNSFFSVMLYRPSSSSFPNIQRLTLFIIETSFFLKSLISAYTKTDLSALPSLSDFSLK